MRVQQFKETQNCQ